MGDKRPPIESIIKRSNGLDSSQSKQFRKVKKSVISKIRFSEMKLEYDLASDPRNSFKRSIENERFESTKSTVLELEIALAAINSDN
jgi:hypothetical protein